MSVLERQTDKQTGERQRQTNRQERDRDRQTDRRERDDKKKVTLTKSGLKSLLVEAEFCDDFSQT